MYGINRAVYICVPVSEKGDYNEIKKLFYARLGMSALVNINFIESEMVVSVLL